MYNLSYFKESDPKVVVDFMRKHPFVMLIGCSRDKKPVATQVPVFIDEKDGKLFLTGHFMRKTDHHLAFEDNPEALAVFTGAHTYVSASWYTEQQQASTWNYISVHARGAIKFLDEPALLKLLERLTTHFENNSHSPASFHHLSTDYINKMIKAIIAFEIEVREIDNVFKLSQNRDETSKKNIVEELQSRGDAESAIIAEEVQKKDAGHMNISLNDKYAIVCGSTQGIGLAIAEELAMLGAQCTLIARNENSLQQAIAKLNTKAGQEHQYLVADFNDPDSLKLIIEKYVHTNKVHILINNSGGPAGGPIVEAAEEEFLNAFNQHLICNHILAKAVIPSMKSAQYGRIINIISTSVKIPLRNLGVSNTIRGAVASWAKTMANELGQFNITVNNVLPGYTETERLFWLISHIAQAKKITAEQVANEMRIEIPLKRFGSAAEIASVAAFLASPAASFVTGTSIPVDGGRTGSI